MSTPLIVAIFSEKGGVGKTSVTTGTAAAAAERGMRVLVVDSDPRGTATNELGIEEARLSQILTLNDLLAIPDDGDALDPAEVIGEVIHPAGEGWPANVSILPAERKLSNRENDPNPIEGRLARGLAALTDFDLVLCDPPARAGGKLVNGLLLAAHTVLVPATLTTDGLHGARHAKASLRMQRVGSNPDLRYSGIIRNAVPSTTKKTLAIHKEIDEKLAEFYPGEVLETRIKDYGIREEVRYACVPITSAPGREAKILTAAYGELVDHLLSGKDMGRG